jgi:hypothetical protein
MRLVFCLPLLLAAGCIASPAAPSANGTVPPAVRSAPLPPVVSDVVQVAQLTGEESSNQTLTRYGVAGTDLGHTFDMDGRLYMVFGDTFGCCIGGGGGPDGARDWRSNTMAVIDDRTPADGLAFAGMVLDAPNHAGQLLRPGRDDVTVIPTNGIAVGERMYLHYMAVRRWGDPGEWELNASGFAWSDDEGQTWTKEPTAVWPGDSTFGQVALTRSEGHLYLLGIPGGRFGGVHLARVPETDVLDLTRYRYFAGETDGAPVWSETPADAVTIVPAPVGELSVLWNPHLGRWLLTYLNEDRAALVVRVAQNLWGPWSEESTLVSGRDYPQLYGAYLHPWLMEDDGATIYFTMSLWRPYNVFLMRARLAPAE